MLYGHNTHSLNTVIKTRTRHFADNGSFFLINTLACFERNSYGDGALLCNTTTLFSVTEKSPLMVTTDIC